MGLAQPTLALPDLIISEGFPTARENGGLFP
jgi:hypothetical protein